VTGTGAASFSGAAGSNDFTNASVPCASAAPVVPAAPAAAPAAPAPAAAAPAALAKTGTESLEELALLGYALIIAGYFFIQRARRLEEESY
jgi:hypothetical protein